MFWMQSHPTLFAQITSNLYASEFSRLAAKFPHAKPPRGLTEYDHFLAMCFGQLTYRESLRDIVGCLSSKPKLLVIVSPSPGRGSVGTARQQRSGGRGLPLSCLR